LRKRDRVFGFTPGGIHQKHSGFPAFRKAAIFSNSLQVFSELPPK
jgi:hypothetical protein